MQWVSLFNSFGENWIPLHSHQCFWRRVVLGVCNGACFGTVSVAWSRNEIIVAPFSFERQQKHLTDNAAASLLMVIAHTSTSAPLQ
jgi:hypothetical protein